MNAPSFLWHDYETFGTSARTDRPAQFAAIRTDIALNEIGTPINILCQPAPDYLPSPGACLVTGISPQQCLEQGYPEYQFAAHIHEAFSQANTCGVGYNTIQFDDEFTRFLFWRNLIEPYSREWQNGGSRWDLLNVVRMFYALRPEGIQWPQAQGKPSFKLELLTQANGITHDAAHDALSDVRATIALARLLRQSNQRLFDFAFNLRKKDQVLAELGLPCEPQAAAPFLHISGFYPTEQGCSALLWPLAQHPVNKNEIIVWDLRYNPNVLATMGAEQIRQRLFTPAEQRAAGQERLPLSTIALNKSPMVLRMRHSLKPLLEQRWHLNVDLAFQHAAVARDLPDMSAIWEQVFSRPAGYEEVDVDADLYGGFLSHNDRRKLDELRTYTGEALARQRVRFEDARLDELFFRYRARNFPDTLSEEEFEQWQAHCAERLLDGKGGARTVDNLLEELDRYQNDRTLRPEQMELLEQLHLYAEHIVPL